MNPYVLRISLSRGVESIGDDPHDPYTFGPYETYKDVTEALQRVEARHGRVGYAIDRMYPPEDIDIL